MNLVKTSVLQRFTKLGLRWMRWCSTVLVQHDDDHRVRRVTLNNPAKRNALSLETIGELRNAVKDDNRVRVIIIQANGRVFSSGHDLKQLSQADLSVRQQIFKDCSELMLEIRASPVPIVCLVNGLAAAAGCQLAASCDIVVCTPQSSFSTPGASVGLFCSTPGIAVSRSANLKTTAYMLLTGRPIDAQQAYVSGLVTKVVPQSELESETRVIVESILSKSGAVIALGKKFMYRQMQMELSSAYEQGTCTMLDNTEMNDCREGVAAFLHKRTPKWTQD